MEKDKIRENEASGLVPKHSHETEAPHFRFLGLPVELRTRVYSYLPYYKFYRPVLCKLNIFYADYKHGIADTSYALRVEYKDFVLKRILHAHQPDILTKSYMRGNYGNQCMEDFELVPSLLNAIELATQNHVRYQERRSGIPSILEICPEDVREAVNSFAKTYEEHAALSDTHDAPSLYDRCEITNFFGKTILQLQQTKELLLRVSCLGGEYDKSFEGGHYLAYRLWRLELDGWETFRLKSRLVMYGGERLVIDIWEGCGKSSWEYHEAQGLEIKIWEGNDKSLNDGILV